MRLKRFRLITCLLLVVVFRPAKAETFSTTVVNSESHAGDIIIIEGDVTRPHPMLQVFKAKRKRNVRLTAAALAFPFPFGIVGLHRIYLGCAPYVPVVYIASLGGAFGVLPFIDCCVILLDKNTAHYQNNKQVFMWIN